MKWAILRKPNKIDCMVVKSYWVISLFYCLGKVYEKVADDILVDRCEVQSILHKEQIGSRSQKNAIDAVARVTQHGQQA